MKVTRLPIKRSDLQIFPLSYQDRKVSEKFLRLNQWYRYRGTPYCYTSSISENSSQNMTIKIFSWELAFWFFYNFLLFFVWFFSRFSRQLLSILRYFLSVFRHFLVSFFAIHPIQFFLDFCHLSSFKTESLPFLLEFSKSLFFHCCLNFGGNFTILRIFALFTFQNFSCRFPLPVFNFQDFFLFFVIVPNSFLLSELFPNGFHLSGLFSGV